MTSLDRPRAQAAATHAIQLRKLAGFTEWHMAGTLTALESAAATASAFEVSQAIIRLASMPDMKTPALLAHPGPWWPVAQDGSKIRRRGDHTMRCPEHGQRLPCEPCKTDITPPPEDVRAEMRAALEEAKTKNAKDANNRRERTERKS